MKNPETEVGLPFPDQPWHGRDLLGTRRHEVVLTEGQLKELHHALEGFRRTGKPAASMTREDFPLPELSATIAGWLDELEDGLGFVLVRGMPVERYGVADLEAMHFGLGLHLGHPVSQTRSGNLFGNVEDRGGKAAGTIVRGHQTNGELPFHCDRCDIITLLCVRPARTGGLSRVASGAALYRAMAATRPDLLRVLMEPIVHDRRGEEGEGQPPWTRLPVFAVVEGRLVLRYIRRFMESAARFEDAPKLTSLQVEAIDHLESLLASPGFALEFRSEPGDLQLLNNHITLHGRTAFTDGPDPGGGRLMTRLWLSSPRSRRLPDSFLPLYGAVGPGQIRGGVAPAPASRAGASS